MPDTAVALVGKVHATVPLAPVNIPWRMPLLNERRFLIAELLDDWDCDTACRLRVNRGCISGGQSATRFQFCDGMGDVRLSPSAGSL